MSMNDLEELRRFALAVAIEAGELTLRYYRKTLAVEQKADDSPVTRADREAETLIRERLLGRFPDDGIFGEEHGVRTGAGRRTWVVDPIDGTRSFVAGVPLYGVLIALLEGNLADDIDRGLSIDSDRVLIGIAHFPAVGESLLAARGIGCLHLTAGSERPARVAAPAGPDAPSEPDANVDERASLVGARITTSDFSDFARREPTLATAVSDARSQSRTWGDAYGYLLVATGRADAMIDPIVSPWDVAPMPVIIEEAGGRFTDLAGRRRVGSSALGANPGIHRSILSARNPSH